MFPKYDSAVYSLLSVNLDLDMSIAMDRCTWLAMDRLPSALGNPTFR